jgi:hypothetical protein
MRALIAFVAAVLLCSHQSPAQETRWVPVGKDVFVKWTIVTRDFEGRDHFWTWHIKNGGRETITTLEFEYHGTKKGAPFVGRDLVPYDLAPGQAHGGWSSFSAVSSTTPGIRITRFETREGKARVEAERAKQETRARESEEQRVRERDAAARQEIVRQREAERQRTADAERARLSEERRETASRAEEAERAEFQRRADKLRRERETREREVMERLAATQRQGQQLQEGVAAAAYALDEWYQSREQEKERRRLEEEQLRLDSQQRESLERARREQMAATEPPPNPRDLERDAELERRAAERRMQEWEAQKEKERAASLVSRSVVAIATSSYSAPGPFEAYIADAKKRRAPKGQYFFVRNEGVHPLHFEVGTSSGNHVLEPGEERLLKLRESEKLSPTEVRLIVRYMENAQ